MSETTSSAIIMTTSVLIACIVISIFIFSYNGIGSMHDASETRQEEMDIKNTDEELYKYVGSTISGYKLQALLKSLASNSDITVTVKNGQYQQVYQFALAGKSKMPNQAHKAFYTTYPYNSSSNGNGVTGDSKEYIDFFTIEDDEENAVPKVADAEPVCDMIKNPSRPDWYIDPFRAYFCDGSESGQAITSLTFTLQA